MNARQLDFLNIGLLLISLLLAYQLPFTLFLLAYAFLGPLHYLTEINWLQRKQYFVGDARWGWIALLFALLIAVPKFFILPPFADRPPLETLSAPIQLLLTYSNVFIFVWLLTSIGLIVSRSKWIIGAFAVGGIIAGLLLNSVNFYQMLIGLMVPTLAHVYLFTLLFMVFGTLKSRSKPGWLAAFVMCLVPFFIAFWEIPAANYSIPEAVKETFTTIGFHNTTAQISQFFGWSDGTSFFFYEQLELKLQVFIAFAYTYHYLNWFSKTTVIGWHKQLTKVRTLVIVAIWLLACILFAVDYQLGFILLLSLSFLHVLMEFPLNALSVKGIAQSIFKPKT